MNFNQKGSDNTSTFVDKYAQKDSGKEAAMVDNTN